MEPKIEQNSCMHLKEKFKKGKVRKLIYDSTLQLQKLLTGNQAVS